MAIPPEKPQYTPGASTQYKQITKALVSDNRIAFDTQTGQFLSISKKTKHAQPEGIVTDLNKLKLRVLEYVTKHGIEDMQRVALKGAFLQKADKLEKSYSLFGRAKIASAVTNLRGIAGIIGGAPKYPDIEKIAPESPQILGPHPREKIEE